VYEPVLRPPVDKTGLLSGMALTERQGGSDVRANETRAEPLADGGYALTGEKWFCSAPMCDVFLVLAYATGGPCFKLPESSRTGAVTLYWRRTSSATARTRPARSSSAARGRS
jgi:alkylation response protein AidB-like acyl-CoA dehydrogenase